MQSNGHHLVDSTGTPFFWLADTAWNLWCRGTPDAWDAYLAVRKEQGFNVIQFVGGWWRGCSQPIHGRTFDVVADRVVFDELALASLDQLMDKIHNAGFVAAPVMLWTIMDDDPGMLYSDDQCIEIATALRRRYDGLNVVWLLGGDGRYESAEAQERWKRIGRAVFAEAPDSMATMHPCGASWVGDAFASEPWYKIVTIQSGHKQAEQHLRFLLEGRYASAWRDIDKPFINIEPNYEDAPSRRGRPLTDHHVRRACYWSLLMAPPAGVTYGISSIWIWGESPDEIAENHGGNWIAQPWHTKLDTPGARSMTVLRQVFENLPWTRLRPAPERLKVQPGQEAADCWQAVAASDDGDCLIAYAPHGGEIVIDINGLKPGMHVYEIDPRTGETGDRGPLGTNATTAILNLPAGEHRDGLLVLR